MNQEGLNNLGTDFNLESQPTTNFDDVEVLDMDMDDTSSSEEKLPMLKNVTVPPSPGLPIIASGNVSPNCPVPVALAKNALYVSKFVTSVI